MNSCFIFVTNIPKSQRPVLLLKELDNKWAKMMHIDNPYSELTDAFIYNPTSNAGHFDIGVQKLRQKEIDGEIILKVYYVWFPPPDISMVTMVPEGSILLPYLLIDHIPKDVEAFDLFGELPFRGNDVKQWDISYKEDKWVILRLLANCDETARNFVLSYTRTKRLPNGANPRANEIIITEKPRLSKTMVPKGLRSLSATTSYKSNFIFLYDLPTKVASQHIIDAVRPLEMRNLKAYLIDIVDDMRVGFVSLPKSLSDYKFADTMHKLNQLELDVDSLDKLRLSISEVWLQPINCLPPTVNKRKQAADADRRRPQFILTSYLYLHNISDSVCAADITVRSPVSIKAFVYPSIDAQTQFGFVLLTGEAGDARAPKVIEYLRSLVFRGLPVLVDEIWIKEYDLPDLDDNGNTRKRVHISRTVVSNSRKMSNLGLEILDQIGYNDDTHIPTIILPERPPISYMLTKSNMLFLINAPRSITKSKLIFDLNIDCEGLCQMDSGDSRVHFLKMRQTTDLKWAQAIERIAFSDIGSRPVIVREVYIQGEETLDLMQSKLPSIHLSSYLFVYNLGHESDFSEAAVLHQMRECCGVSLVEAVAPMVPDEGGSRSVLVRLTPSVAGPAEVLAALRALRSIRMAGGRRVYAGLVWLGKVDTSAGPPLHMRGEPLPKRNCIEDLASL